MRTNQLVVRRCRLTKVDLLSMNEILTLNATESRCWGWTLVRIKRVWGDVRFDYSLSSQEHRTCTRPQAKCSLKRVFLFVLLNYRLILVRMVNGLELVAIWFSEIVFSWEAECTIRILFQSTVLGQ